jgi:predicted RNase H-like nuclease
MTHIALAGRCEGLSTARDNRDDTADLEELWRNVAAATEREDAKCATEGVRQVRCFPLPAPIAIRREVDDVIAVKGPVMHKVLKRRVPQLESYSKN